jgi:hypothetical protein
VPRTVADLQMNQMETGGSQAQAGNGNTGYNASYLQGGANSAEAGLSDAANAGSMRDTKRAQPGTKLVSSARAHPV